MAQLMSIKKNVDVQPGVGVPAIFHASQGDKGTRIILGLLNNNDTYTIPEGTTAIIRGSRADGTLFTEITADIDTTTEIKFNLTEDMTSVAGPVECEAVMTSGTANVIGTANFIINIEKSPASIGSVFPATDAAETWLIDELTNLDISGLDDESVVDAINSKLGGTFETTDAGKVLMVNQDGSVSPSDVDLSGKADESTIAPEFDSSAAYTAGQYVYKNGVLFRFTAAHSGAWTGTDAVDVTATNEIETLNNKCNDVVIISEAEPSSEYNKIWINENAQTVQIPTMQDLLKAFIEETTTNGTIASFTDGADEIPTKLITVHGEPIKSGDGTPTPSNIINYSGRTSCQIKHSGNDVTVYDTYNITFPDDAGTVYAFALEILENGTGLLTKTHKFSEIPTDVWAKGGSRFYRNIPDMKNINGGNVGWCSHYKSVMGTAANNGEISYGDKYYSNSSRVVVVDTNYSTAAEFMSFLNAQKQNNTPVTIIYPLASPVSYNLTAEQVKTILGENNLWSDAGNIEVTYRADTKLYINKMVS